MSLFVLTDSLVPTQYYKEHKFSAGGLYAHSASTLINIITPKEWSYLTEVLKGKNNLSFLCSTASPLEMHTLDLLSFQWHKKPGPDSHYSQGRSSRPDTS